MIPKDTTLHCGQPGPGRFFSSGILPTLGGLAALMAVMGIGRFAYTALLPSMLDAFALDERTAGFMAAFNFAGYLAGVLLMRGQKPGLRRYVFFAAALLLSLATTAGMGLVRGEAFWHGMRFLSGLASGAAFVLCSAIVLDTLAAIDRPVLAGLLYSGVGAGIALGGLSAQPLLSLGGVNGAWIGMALFCLPLAGFALFCLRPGVNAAPALPGPRFKETPDRDRHRAYYFLLLAYFLEGFGYIIGATFLVALVQKTTGSPEVAGAAWIVTGIAAAVSTPLWRFAARKGYLTVLICAFLVQAAGVLLPVLSGEPQHALVGGLLLGGTFMGITVLSLQYGVLLSGNPSAHTVAVMTALYGAGQILGPFAAGLSAEGRGFGPAFLLSAAALFLGAGVLAASALRERTK